ncbi:MAG: lipopolysaccharide heptosyltransferase II, partial [Candidatus Methylomirabilales bacterium]
MRVRYTRPFKLEEIQRVLVRGPNWVGDAVLSTPALANLRKALPWAHISLLVKPWVSGLFEGNPHLDRIILYEDRHKGLISQLRLAGELKMQGFDLCILFPNSFSSALLAFLAGVPHRVGYGTDLRGFLLTAKVYPNPPPSPGEGREGGWHQVEYYVGLLQALGLDRGERDLVLKVSQEEEAQAQALLEGEGVEGDELLVGLNPGSVYGSAKRWPAERYAALADELTSRFGAKILLFGSAKEVPITAQVQRFMRSQAVNLAGKTTVKLLAALLKRCRVLVTNDTGAMHIASAVRTPIVALFGPTDPRVTSPWGMGHTLLRNPPSCAPCLLRECPIDHRCMTAISIKEVLYAVERYLPRRQLDVRCQMLDVGKQEGSPASNIQHPTSSSLAPAVFLDRDGTLNEEVGYLGRPEGLRLLPRAAEALKLLKGRGFKRIVISNQSGIARGYLSREEVDGVNRRLLQLLADAGGGVEGIYYCPHGPEEGCFCRKPEGG